MEADGNTVWSIKFNKVHKQKTKLNTEVCTRGKVKGQRNINNEQKETGSIMWQWKADARQPVQNVTIYTQVLINQEHESSVTMWWLSSLFHDSFHSVSIFKTVVWVIGYRQVLYCPTWLSVRVKSTICRPLMWLVSFNKISLFDSVLFLLSHSNFPMAAFFLN